MKKTILLINIMLLTGCLGRSAQGYITKTCENEENINGNKVKTLITLTSKEGHIENITKQEIYDESMNIEAIKNSKKSEQNLYKTEPGIDLYIENNTFLYTINTKEINDTIKERLNIKDELHRQLDYYESIGYTCK